MSATNYLENKFLRWLLLGEAMPAFTDLYVALYATVDEETAAGVEISGGAYTRLKVNRASDGTWSVVSATSTGTNTNALFFPTATADWGSIGYWGLCDALSGGNALVIAPINGGTVTVPNRSRVSFDPSALSVSVN